MNCRINNGIPTLYALDNMGNILLYSLSVRYDVISITTKKLLCLNLEEYLKMMLESFFIFVVVILMR